MTSIDLTLFDKAAKLIKTAEEEEKDSVNLCKPGQLVVIKGIKISDYKGLTVVGYEDSTSIYMGMEQLKAFKRVQEVDQWYLGAI